MEETLTKEPKTISSNMIEIGNISSYYGPLCISKFEDKFYMAVEDWNCINWEEIPESLYTELLNYNENRLN